MDPSPAVVDIKFDPVISLYTFMALRKVSDDRYNWPRPLTLDVRWGVEIYPLDPRFATMEISWPLIVLAERRASGAFDMPEATVIGNMTSSKDDCRKREDMYTDPIPPTVDGRIVLHAM
jgi:hypothetical protein